MKREALEELTVEELNEREGNMRKELFNLRFQAAIGHIENPNRFKEVRREIARLLTAIKEKKSVAT
ncbi:MAG: 50S ribosomal protein L29 [Nitrospiria bacterium]